MKHLLALLLLLFSFSAFAYENPYRDQKRWEAEERYDNPQNFSSGRDAHYWDNQHDVWEENRRREDDAERERREFNESVGH